VKIDAFISKDITATKANARRIEDEGYDGLWTGETTREPFLQLLQVAEATDRITLGTSIAIAFARSPMTVANAGFDLALYSGGRFVLGLGTQVKPHIERRFSMPWSHPAPRLREFVLALRAIWSCWQEDRPLDFSGDYYCHTLMTPFFAPEAHEYGPPPVYVAGVGSLMTEVAGEVADGFFFHPFTTPRYLREVTLPALTRGRAKAGSNMEGFVVAGPAFAAVGRDEGELATALAGTKQQIAFYASTPAYRPVLEVHGWQDIQPELTSLTKQGRWSELGGLVDDEMLHEFAVVGDPATVGRELRARLDGTADRITIYATYDAEPGLWREVVDALRR